MERPTTDWFDEPFEFRDPPRPSIPRGALRPLPYWNEYVRPRFDLSGLDPLALRLDVAFGWAERVVSPQDREIIRKLWELAKLGDEPDVD